MTRRSSSSDEGSPGFRAALSNRKVQVLIGLLTAATAASATALAMSASAPDASGVHSRAQIEEIVRDYILEHPEILPQAMERLKAKHTTAAIDAQRSEIETPFAGAWEGAENGDVVLVEFFDYACGYCRASLSDLAQIAANDPKVKIVYRELPILSEQSNLAAKVSLLAAEQGKYMPFHKALYVAGKVTRESIISAAASAGIDRKAAESAMSSDRYDAEIEKNIKLAQALGASGTPTFVVGNQVLNGAVGHDAIKAAVEAARVKK